jgi:hypothetical protein
MSIDYQGWYNNAKAELQRVQQEKAEMQGAIAERDKQIDALIQTLNALGKLVGEEFVAPREGEPEPPAGMTDSIRTILAQEGLTQAGAPLTASEIRDRLEARGFDIKSYSNPMANIHTILRRLTESGEVETTHELNAPSGGGKRFTMQLTKNLAVEKLAGKSFEIGKVKGFIGVGRLRRRVGPK